MNRQSQKYADRILWVLVYPLMALGAVHFANDNSIRKLITIPSYYSDLVFAFAFTYGIGFYLLFITKRIDFHLTWRHDLRKRIYWQFALGIMVPLLFLFVSEGLYLTYGLHISLRDSSIFNLELPLGFVFLLLINVFYYALALRNPTESAQQVSATYLPFRVAKGSRQLLIEHREVAFFYIQEGVTFLYTLRNERYVIPNTLESLEQNVDLQWFFKLNRQMLASRASIAFVETTSTRKLSITLTLPFHEVVFVSKANASNFQKWWRNTVPVSN